MHHVDSFFVSTDIYKVSDRDFDAQVAHSNTDFVVEKDRAPPSVEASHPSRQHGRICCVRRCDMCFHLLKRYRQDGEGVRGFVT
jgi:hypothetical protein